MSIPVSSLPDSGYPWLDQLEAALQAARNELRAIAALPLRTGYRWRVAGLLDQEAKLLVQLADEAGRVQVAA